MRVRLSAEMVRSESVRKIEETSGQNLLACYQCGKCSAGCPAADSMDLLPSQVVRLAQLGLIEQILRSQSVWYCAACLSCAARCPKGVDLARIMEAVRRMMLDVQGDHIAPNEIPPDEIVEWPQQALVGGFRKYTS